MDGVEYEKAIKEEPTHLIRVVENEWLSLTPDQRSIYENIAKDNSQTAIKLDRN